jgi:hypothetical protein
MPFLRSLVLAMCSVSAFVECPDVKEVQVVSSRADGPV